MSDILSSVGDISVATSLLSQVEKLVSSDASFLSQSTPTNLFPLRTLGNPNRVTLAGRPDIEAKFHQMMVPGQRLETGLGEVMTSLMEAKEMRNHFLNHYLDITRVSITSKLPLYPRSAKSVLDCIHFFAQMQAYLLDIQKYVFVMQANLSYLLAIEARLENMFTQNSNLLTAILNDICNWHLPSLPSIPQLLGSLPHWPGFNFNAINGFQLPNLQSLTLGLNFNTLFSFNQCTVRSANLASLFSPPATSITVGTNIATTVGGTLAPNNGVYGEATNLTDPAYIATMQATTSLVIDPTVSTTMVSSLPNPASIISNYSLNPATYAANIVSLQPALQPALAAQSNTALAQLSSQYITLEAVVTSGYDPNLTAAWLFSLQLNRQGRAGIWVAPFAAQYTESITPSTNYLAESEIPFNQVLGGEGLLDAPLAIPLIATLKEQTTSNLLWRLSYIEANLLGISRYQGWDTSADTTYLTGATGTSPDYVPNQGDFTVMASMVLGADTASYPVDCLYPAAITSVLSQVITQAAIDIAGNTAYVSPSAKNRYTYNEFAEAILVDHFSQFYRDLNDSLRSLLQADPYTLSFAVQNFALLNSAINPLGSSAAYASLYSDAMSRNRLWTPGSVLLPLPELLVLQSAAIEPTVALSGWSGGTFDAATFLARPDIQAQTLPVQAAMLQLNQAYASLNNLKTSTMASFANIISNVQASIATSTSSGWEVDTAIEQLVPAVQDALLSFETIAFDQGSYVENPTTILINITSMYAMTGQVIWDSLGTLGSRRINLLRNGVVLDSFENDPQGNESFTISFSGVYSLNVNDTITVSASHSLPTPQSVVSGRFLGVQNTASNVSDTAIPSLASITLGQQGAILAKLRTATQAGTAISLQGDGTVIVVPITQATATPLISMDGVTLEGGEAGAMVMVAQAYGSTYTVPGANYTPGQLLYVQPNGLLSGTVVVSGWVLVAGKATGPSSFIYQAQLPIYR
jgi:hypothetical protein